MSIQLLKIIVAGALLLHGIAHAIATLAIVLQTASGLPSSKLPISTWMSSALSARAVAGLALPFWLASSAAFLLASGAFWGLASTIWRQFAVVGAFVSTLGILMFPLTWPGSVSRARSLLNTSIALAFNIVVLVSLLVYRWPPLAVFAK